MEDCVEHPRLLQPYEHVTGGIALAGELGDGQVDHELSRQRQGADHDAANGASVQAAARWGLAAGALAVAAEGAQGGRATPQRIAELVRDAV